VLAQMIEKLKPGPCHLPFHKSVRLIQAQFDGRGGSTSKNESHPEIILVHFGYSWVQFVNHPTKWDRVGD
jgi:hypothetical protein